VAGLKDDYDLVAPGGAFYAFPRAPWGTATEFVSEAIAKHELLIIPGNVFSKRDTHFRISYATADAVIERGVDVLRKMARKQGLGSSD
jgi:aspartate aminotransferase/aminotransferase